MMELCSIRVSDYLFECFEKYHVHYSIQKNRTLNDTVSVLVNYVLGYSSTIDPQEIETIESFFNQNQKLLHTFLEWVLDSGYDPDKLYFVKH